MITHPQNKAGALIAIMQACKNGGLDLDTVFKYDTVNSNFHNEDLL